MDALPSFDETTPVQPAQQAMPAFEETKEAPLPAFEETTDPDAAPAPGKYDDNKSMLKTFGEGISQGVAGPLAAYAEKKLTNEKPEDILGREEAHPYIHGAGTALGFAVSIMTGVGEGRLIAGAGEFATHAMQSASIGQKIAKGAAAAAVEMGLFQASDEATKAVLDAPNTIGTMATNIGLSATLGGLTGGTLTGVGAGMKGILNSSVVKDMVDTIANNYSHATESELVSHEVGNVYSAYHDIGKSIETLPPAVQKTVVKSIEKTAPEMKAFEKRFTELDENGQKVISPEKLDSYMNVEGRGSRVTDRQKTMGKFINSMSDHFDKVNQAFEDAGVTSPFDAVGMSALKNSIEQPSIGTKLGRQVLGRMRADTMGNALGLITGEIISPGFGGAYIGKHVAGPAFTAMLKPLMDSFPTVNGKVAVGTYALLKNIAEGNSMVKDAVGSVFGTGKVLAPKFMPRDEDLDKLDEQFKSLNSDPQKMGVNLPLLPEHSMYANKQLMAQSMYINQQRPNPQPVSMLDHTPAVTNQQKSSFKQTLRIAQQPMSILQRVKDGTVTPKDAQDIKALYPEFADHIAKSLLSEVAKAKASDTHIPYTTRLGLSLVIGQPLDSTMSPQSIQAAQPVPRQPQQAAQGAKSKGEGQKHSTSSLSKVAGSFKTPNQTAESDRSDRS